MSHSVVCEFEECSSSIISRVVMAAIDQMCSDVDIPVDLLDAFEFPLEESLEAMSQFGIVRAEVSTAGRLLEVDVELATQLDDPVVRFGESDDVVRSFFDVRVADGGCGFSLIGRLE